MHRLKGVLIKYGLWKADYAKRIKIITGDLSKPKLGIGQATFSSLVAEVKSIVLSGAQVHFLHPYKKLRHPNVNSLRDFLTESFKFDTAIHYISSLSVFSETLNSPISDDTEPTINLNSSGYAQSKWVADCLAKQALIAYKNTSIYRLGDMMPSSATGAMNEASLFTHFAKCVGELRCFPENNLEINYMPVDICAKLISTGMWNSTLGYTFNITSSVFMDVREIIDRHLQLMDNKVHSKVVSDDDFFAKIQKTATLASAHPSIQHIASILPDSLPEEGILKYLFQDTSENIHSSTMSLLRQKSGVKDEEDCLLECLAFPD